METIRNFYRRAFSETSIASLVYFRILFGIVMMWEVYRYFSKDWIKKYYIRPEYNFKYLGFEWVEPLAGNGMYYVWGLLGVLALFITIGFLYRISTIIFFFTFVYVYLCARTHYLNHFYFAALVSLAMIFVSPHKTFSIDSKLGWVKDEKIIPIWQLWLFRFEMGVVYFYGGIAKIDPDWIFGTPLDRWLNKHADVPFIGKLIVHDYSAIFLSWTGMLLDLFIVPALLYKRTRIWGYLALFIFHVSNHFLFTIGIFPWFSLAITLLYFSSDFPIKIFEKIKKVKLNWPSPNQPNSSPLNDAQINVAILLTIFVSYNCLMPLRHHLYKGDTHWNERGHMYSWRMKLRSKSGRTPIYYFKDRKTGEEWNEKASDRLSRRQTRKMSGNPEMIVQYAHYLRDQYHLKGHNDLQVRVKAKASINFRPYQYIINPDYNLENEKLCLFCNPKYLQPLGGSNKRSWSDSYRRFKTKRL